MHKVLKALFLEFLQRLQTGNGFLLASTRLGIVGNDGKHSFEIAQGFAPPICCEVGLTGAQATHGRFAGCSSALALEEVIVVFFKVRIIRIQQGGALKGAAGTN